MVNSMKETQQVELLVRRTVPFKISLNVSDSSFGSCVTSASAEITRSLVIIKTHAALQKWNEQNPSSEVKPGDRIAEVNDVKGDLGDLTKMKKTLETATS